MYRMGWSDPRAHAADTEPVSLVGGWRPWRRRRRHISPLAAYVVAPWHRRPQSRIVASLERAVPSSHRRRRLAAPLAVEMLLNSNRNVHGESDVRGQSPQRAPVTRHICAMERAQVDITAIIFTCYFQWEFGQPASSASDLTSGSARMDRKHSSGDCR